jgi:hypothetical protein
MNNNNNNITNIKDKSFSSSSTSSSTSSNITVINSATSETNNMNNMNNNMNDKTSLLMNNKLNENFKSLKSSQKSINRQNSFCIDELLTVQVNATNKLFNADSMTTVIPNCNNDSLNNNNTNDVLSYEDKIPLSISTNFYGFDDAYDDYQDKLKTTRTNNNNKFNNNNNDNQQQQNSNKSKNLFVNEECSLKSSFNSVRYFNIIFLLQY